MKAPSFWQSKNLVSNLLLPLAVPYFLISRLQRALVKPLLLPVPVICVGGLTAGGAGKTPVALYIGERLKEKNIEAFFLSRGYGGGFSGPARVDPDKHAAKDVGDEPLLLARILPTIIARDRASGARMAVAQGAKAIIMDDGFQNPFIAKTLALVVVDGAQGFGNGRLIPAGPLREPAASGLRRADAVIGINGAAPIPSALSARTVPLNLQELSGKKVLAFCGLAAPDKFFHMLDANGVTVVARAAFADHHLYTAQEFESLDARARALDAVLATTAKDAVRLSPEARSKVKIVQMALAFDEPGRLDALLMRAAGA